MDMRFLKLLMALVMMLAAFHALVYVQVPTEVSSLSLGGTFSQAGEDLNIGFIGGVPIGPINGHIA